jgi:hypothetical protein
MKNLFNILLTISTMILIFGACNNRNNSNETKAGDSSLNDKSIRDTIMNDTLKIHPLSPEEIISLSDTISPEIDTSNSKGLFGGKGKLWRLWEKLHKNCQNSAMTKGMTFLGVSNTVGVGSIILYDNTKKGYFASYPLLKEKFNPEQQKLIFNNGTSTTCSFLQNTKVTSEFLIKSNIINSGNGSLNAQIQNAKSVDSKIDSWQQDALYLDAFKGVINHMNDDYSMNYLAASKLPGRYIIATEIQITGFSALINTKTTISADLIAELEKGISEKIGDTNATVKFSYEGEKTIKVSTTGSFIVFGALYSNN